MKKIVAPVFALVAMVAAGCGPDLGTPTPDPRFPDLRGYPTRPCNAQASPGLQGRVGFCDPPSITRNPPCAVGQLFCAGSTWVCADLPHGTACPVETVVHGPMDGGVADASVPVDASPDAAPATDTGSVPAVDAGPPVDAGAACQAGVGVCRRSGVWRTNMYGNRFCDAVPAAPTAEICNGLDDNCDGTVDNGITCACLVGATRVCYAGPTATRGVGICRDGQQRCVGTAPTAWGSCDGQVLPRPEVPNNGLDDNCDGVADNP